MFNLNFKKLFFNGIWNSGEEGTNYPKFDNPTNITDINGTTQQIGSTIPSDAESTFDSIINALSGVVKNTGSSMVGQSYFKLGTGTTTPTEDDYDIETEASELVINQVTQATTATFEKAYNLNITNTGSSTITLSEVVQVLRVYGDINIAISRTLTAVSFAPGETKTIMIGVSL